MIKQHLRIKRFLMPVDSRTSFIRKGGAMRVAVYVRVSTVHQAHHQTIEQQLERLRPYLHEQGLDLSERLIFRD